jgi:hypothetical protein
MYSTPVLQVARRFGAGDITESRLLKYDVICGCVWWLSEPELVVKREPALWKTVKAKVEVGDVCASLAHCIVKCLTYMF